VWNQCASRLVGYSTAEVMGHSLVIEFITKDYQASVQSVLDRALEGMETANFEFPLITKDGARIEILLNATTRRNEHGKVIGVVGIGQDITARLTQEREYSKLIDNANAPIFGVDTQGRVNVWNKCARKLVGYALDEVMGQNLVSEFITKEYKDAVSAVLDKALKGQETANFEFPLITKHGVKIEVLLNATARRDEQGNVIGVVGIGQDITGRIAQEREYSKLIDTANAPIFGVDTQGRVNVWNQCARRLVGYNTSEVMGCSLVQEFITEDYQESVQAVLDRALEGVETANFEFPLITKAGARIDILLNATTRRSEHGKVIGVVGIGQDITDSIISSYVLLAGRIAQEREYSKLIDSANAPIFGVDTQGRVNIWNQCAMKLVGYSIDEVMGKNLVQEFITKEYRAVVSTVLDEAMNGQETANFEFPLITKHGVRIEVLLNATTRRNEQGNIIGVVGIGQDITGRIAQEREYSKLIDTANAPIFGVDTKGQVNVWNQCARKLVGYTTEEVMGHSLVQGFISNDYQASVQAVLDRALYGEETANFEFPLMTKAGARIEILLNATTRRDEHGIIIGVVGIGQDITFRIAQEREYSKLIDHANAPIIGVNTHGKVNVWNKCASRLVGYSTDEVMGHQLVEEFITKDYQASVQTVLDKALDGIETANFEFPLMTKAGVRLEVLLNATTRRDEKGDIIGVVGIGQDITGRIAQEREYSKLIDSANAPIFGVDNKGKVNIWNQCAVKLVGYTTEEVMGQSLVREFITPQHRARVQSVIDRALAGDETTNFEFPLMTKGGVLLEVLLNATTRRNEQGSIIGVVGIGQDITARLAQEREYTRLIDTANAPIFGVDAQGGVNVWNQCAVRLSGYTSEEVMGRSLVKAFVRMEHQERVQEVLNEALQGEETANFDFPLMTKARNRLEILLNATCRRDEHGNIIGVVGIGQNITDRIAQEREFSKLIDNANAPIFGVDTDGRVDIWNQCASALTGFSKADVFGKSLVDDFISDDFKESISDILSNALMGIETSNFEFPLLTSGDHVVEVLLNATTRRDAQDSVIGVVGIGQDITEARAKRDAEMKQRAAEAATAAQATISAHVYHEIRNVVSSVLALADRAKEAVDLALIDDSDGEDGLKELPTRVRELTDHQRLVCQHAVDTLNDMLDVAKMENGTYTPKHEVIDLGELCQKAAALQSPRMRPHVKLGLNVPAPDTVFVISDSVLLLQYLSNLLSNAAKFTSTGGVVLVCKAREAGPNWLEVTLGVADSGPGIRRESQRHVLRAFTTGDALPQEDRIGGTKSTGIGLRLADLIAHTISEPSLKPHRGESIVTSEEVTSSEKSFHLYDTVVEGLQISSPLDPSCEHYVPGGGPGTFIFFLSAIQRASPEAIAHHHANQAGESSDKVDFGSYIYKVEFSGIMRVLVVDDQRTMRQMVAMIYQKLAVDYPGIVIDCYTALSGEQAIRMCRKYRFHVITMDQQMSSDYCQSLLDEMSMSERPDCKIPAFVRFGSDKISNAKSRQAYFKNDQWIQDIEPGDGNMLGHEAIRIIRREIQERDRPPTLIFNLTGNILEADRLMFLEVGSSGIIPKPTKAEDFLNIFQKNMGLYISQGLIQVSNGRVVMDDGDFQLGTRFRREVDIAGDALTERSKIVGPWAGGATQRNVGACQVSQSSTPK